MKAQTENLDAAGKHASAEHDEPLNTMVYETYQYSKQAGTIEVGFCFKASAGTDDRLPFDLVVGDFGPDDYDAADLQALWAQHEWAAQAIVAAGRLRAIKAGRHVRHERSAVDQPQALDLIAPALFEVDPTTGHATGVVMPFCSVECREAAGGVQYAGLQSAVAGITQLGSFGYEAHCEHCANDIGSALAPARGVVGFYRPDPSGPKSPNIVLDVVEDKVLVYEPSGMVFMIDRAEWMSRAEMEADTATVPTAPHYEPRHSDDTLRKQVLKERKLALNYADRIAPTIAEVLATHPSVNIKTQPADIAG